MSDVHDFLGAGEGRDYGTAFHTEFAQRVRGLNIKDLGIETSFDKQEEVRYGSDGSIRTDVVLRDYTTEKPSVIAIWDVKTGNADMRPSRASEIRNKVGADWDTPLIQLQVNTGIRNKEVVYVRGR